MTALLEKETARSVEEKSLTTLRAMTTRWVEDFESVSKILARLDSEQMREAKKILAPFVSAEHCERLALYGQMKIGSHLAFPRRSLPAGILRRLSAKARDDLAKPNAPIEVYGEHGTKIKTLAEMNPVELAMAIDPISGIRTPQQQKKHFVSLLPETKTSPKHTRNVRIMSFSKLIPDRDHGMLVIYGASEDGDSEIGIEIPLKTLRELIA